MSTVLKTQLLLGYQSGVTWWLNNQEILHGSCRLIRAPGTMSLVQGLADLTGSDLRTLWRKKATSRLDTSRFLQTRYVKIRKMPLHLFSIYIYPSLDMATVKQCQSQSIMDTCSTVKCSQEVFPQKASITSSQHFVYFIYFVYFIMFHLFHHVSPCFIIMFHHTSSCFIIVHHVSSYFIMFHLFHHVSPCFIIMFYHTSWCFIIVQHVLSYFIMFHHNILSYFIPIPAGLWPLRLGTVCPASLVHALGGLTGVFAAKTTSVDAVDVNCAKNATSTRLPVRSNMMTKQSRNPAWFLQTDSGSRHDVAGARSGRPDRLRSQDFVTKKSNIAVGHVQVFANKICKDQKDALTPVQHLHLSIAGHGNS